MCATRQVGQTREDPFGRPGPPDRFLRRGLFPRTRKRTMVPMPSDVRGEGTHQGRRPHPGDQARVRAACASSPPARPWPGSRDRRTGRLEGEAGPGDGGLPDPWRLHRPWHTGRSRRTAPSAWCCLAMSSSDPRASASPHHGHSDRTGRLRARRRGSHPSTGRRPVGARRRQGVAQGAAAHRQASTCSARSLLIDGSRRVRRGEGSRSTAVGPQTTHPTEKASKPQVTDARKITSTQNAARSLRCCGAHRPPENAFPQVGAFPPGEGGWGGWDSNPKGDASHLWKRDRGGHQHPAASRSALLDPRQPRCGGKAGTIVS